MKHQHIFHSFFLFGIFLIINILFSGCGGTPQEPVIYIPNDAQIAIHIDLKSMSKKAENWQNLFNPDNLSKWDVPIESQETMSKVVQEGLDTNTPLLVFGKTKEDEYSVLAFRAKDRSIFQQIIEDNDGEFKSAEGITAYYVVLKEGKSYAFAEDDNILLINKEANVEEITAFYKSLKEVTKEVALSAKNEVYKKLMNEPHEIAFWLDAPVLDNESLSALKSLGLPKPSESQEAKRQATGVVLFENGKASLNFNMSLDDELKGKLEKILGSTADEAVQKNIPIANPSALLALSFNMNGIYEILKEEGNARGMKESADLLGVSEDAMMNIFTGSMALNLDKLSLLSLGEGKIKADAVLSLPYNNEEAVNKILEEIVSQGALEKKGDYYITTEEVADLYTVDIYFFTKDKTLYVTITEEMKDKIMKGENALKSEFKTMLQNQGAFLYFDIPKVYGEIGLLGENVFEEIDVKAISESIASTTLGIPTMKDGKLQLTLEVNTISKDKNALQVLVKLLKDSSDKTPA